MERYGLGATLTACIRPLARRRSKRPALSSSGLSSWAFKRRAQPVITNARVTRTVKIFERSDIVFSFARQGKQEVCQWLCPDHLNREKVVQRPPPCKRRFCFPPVRKPPRNHPKNF